MTSASPESAVTELCHRLMQAVVNAIMQSGREIADLDQAVAVMRAEMRAFLGGEEYKNERECVRLGSLSSQTIFASVVASCISKIQTKPINR